MAENYRFHREVVAPDLRAWHQLRRPATTGRLVLGLWIGTLIATGEARGAEPASNVSPAPPPTLSAPAKHERDEREIDEKETEEEERMLENAMKKLHEYRAPSCEVAVEKMRALLQRGKGRWHERNHAGALPGDLLRLLTEAEMWQRESRPVCEKDPARPRYDGLRLLTETIWRYPKKISRNELDERLRVLDDSPRI